MPNSMLALLALVGTMFLVLRQHQTLDQDRTRMVKGELEIMASGVALQIMEQIATCPFDEATAGEDFDPETFSTSSLASWPFNNSDTLTFSEAQYLEDFDGMTIDTLDFEVGDISMPFSVDISVQYLDESKAHSSGQTDVKEVTVEVSHARYTSPLVTLRRSFSP